MKFKTMSVHSGQRIDPQTGALTTPLYQSSTFSYVNAQAGKERFAGQAGLTHQCLYFEQPHTFEQILFIQTAEPALVGHA